MISMEDYRLKKAIEIEEVDLNVTETDRKVFDLTLEKYMSKYDPDNKMSISECIKVMATSDVRSLYAELIKLKYEQ